MAAAARTLLDEPVELARDARKVWHVNGQHRTEAMLRQGVEEAVMVDTRLIDEPPLPGEIGRICVWRAQPAACPGKAPGNPQGIRCDICTFAEVSRCITGAPR